MLTANSYGDLAFIPNIPTNDVLVSRGNEAALGGGGSQATFGFRNADADGTDGTRARGQSFTFLSGGMGETFDISSLNVALAGGAGNTIRPDGDLELTVFQWDSNDPDVFTNWNAGTGGINPGTTELFRESFDIPAGTQISNADLVEISLNQGELQLVDGTSYGFLFNYTLDSVAGLNADVTIAFDADNLAPADAAGGLLNTNLSGSFATAANGTSVTRDLNYHHWHGSRCTRAKFACRPWPGCSWFGYTSSTQLLVF